MARRRAGEDRNSLAENPVVGGAAAAEVVVIHAGKVVVDEGISVDAFDGAGDGQGGCLIAAGSAGGGEAEDGAETFTPSEEAIAHGLVNECWVGLFGDEPIQGLFDHRQAGFPIGLRLHGAMI